MVLRLIARSPRRRIRFVTVADGLRFCQTRLGLHNLRQLGISNGCRNHTSSPYAATSFVCAPFDRSRVWLNPEPALQFTCAPNAAASTASNPASVTIAIRPSVGSDDGGYRGELGQATTEIFLPTGLDMRVNKLPVGQISGDNKAHFIPAQRPRPHPEERPLGRVSKGGRESACCFHPSRRLLRKLLRMRPGLSSHIPKVQLQTRQRIRPHPEERPLGRVSKGGRESACCFHPSRRLLRKLLRMRPGLSSHIPKVQLQTRQRIRPHPEDRPLGRVSKDGGESMCCLHPSRRLRSLSSGRASRGPGGKLLQR
jgi:hypothetical protein